VMSSEKNAPLLSIIIPTRNRQKYAISAITSILNIPAPDLELVVQDNSDNDDLERLLSSRVRDPRLCYNHTRGRLNIMQNFDRAMEMATGEYVCFIGDDDGVNPEIVDAVEWAKAQGLDAILPTQLAVYYWPDVRFRYYGAAFSGVLNIKPFTGRILFPDIEAEMKRCARIAGRELGNLPRVYYGIVKRECMKRVKDKAATYFPGPSPDLANAVAVANYVERMCVVDYPLFVTGISGGSGGGLGARKMNVGRLEDQVYLPKHYVNDWSNLVPKFHSGQTTWGESVVQALKAVGREELLRDFNIPLLHAMCAVFNPSYFSVTTRSFYHALRATKRSYLLGTIKFFYSCFYTWGLRFKFLSRNLLALLLGVGPHTIKEVGNIEDAANALTEYLKTTGKQFDQHG